MFCENKKSFSAIGVLISIYILTTGILAVIGLASGALSAAEVESDRIIAMGLAQEGIEIIRNIRDINFLKETDWRSGLNSGACRVHYFSTDILAFSDAFLRFSESNFYTYSAGGETKFKRKIDLLGGADADSDEFLKVQCAVSWNAFGKSYSYLLEEKLYDWQKD